MLGIPLGVLVTITSDDGLWPHKACNRILGWIVNIGRSIPFIILLVAIIPFTRFSAAPFVARMVEQSLREIDGSLIEAAQSMGASTWQIVWKVYLKESVPSLVRGASIVFITLFGYAAMAGTVGAGGLGDIAIRYGYQRYQTDVMIVTIVILVVLVQIVQSIGDVTARKMDKRNR